ncbi:SirA family protein [Methanolacinia petrolearia DSM 11571]|uniref:SirA family protein n=1 Tax=Methanolacinia petrolearia (strain DSM 11571 / OCM 486 / SEBR 4847) TaxID=679926 RepID=E1RJH8_METP4|nr:sulfurtransferase TusA family protein [Methanolacinia petrolearia]ADN36784.1 SirA family protein [Methanolacinia petrolearia DSM 11571]
MVKTLDVTGKSCPIPVLETKKMLRSMASGEELLVVVDYPPSKDNIIRFVNRENDLVSNVTEEDSKIFILIKKGGD